MLRIQLFGKPSVTRGDSQIIISRRATRALLFFLAGQQKPVSRDVLLELFWPGKTMEKARQHLADTLSKLRANLGEEAALQVTQGYISINQRVVQVDWLDFDDLMKEIQRQPGAFHAGQALSASAYQKMMALVQLWDNRGLVETDDVVVTPALEAWLTDLRLESSGFLRRVLVRLGEHETLAGNYDQAITWLKMARELQEFDENLDRSLLEAYLQAQRYAEARSFFMQLKIIYGMPDGEPAFLRELEPRLNFTHPSADPAEHPNWSIQPGPPVPFIGQDAALAELTAMSKRGGGVIVMGDAGSGKTRLVYEFCRQQGAGTRLFVATCQPLEASMPFAPWVGMLRASIREATWRRLGASWATPLTLLLPEIQNLRPELSRLPPGSLEVSRSVLLEAIYQLLHMLARESRIIIFLDDAHWADESSLALVAYLLKKSFFRPGHALLILSARVEEKNPLLDEFLLSGLQPPLHRIHTRLFSQADLAALCTFLLSRPAPVEFLDKLEYDSGGNEYYSIQILQAFMEENPEPDFERVDRLPMPPSIVDAMRGKFSALSASAQDLINTAAVMGSQFDIPVLEDAVRLSAEAYFLALDELEQAHVIRPRRDDGLVFGFVHEKLRESILFNLNQNRKRLLHRRVTAAMEKHLPAVPAGQAALLAYHYEEAGSYPQAFDAWVQAAQSAWRLMAVYEAIGACQRAEHLIPRSSELTDMQIYRLYGVWNQIAFENDDFKALEAINQSLQTLGKERGSDLLIGVALTGLSDSEMARNNFQLALDLIGQAGDYIERTDSLFEKARVYQRHGVYHYMLGRLLESQPYFLQALELTKDASEANFLIERGSTFFQLALTESLRGYPLQGLEYARQSLVSHQRAGYSYGQIVGYSVMALANYLMVKYPEGRENALLGIQLAERVGGWRMYGYLCSYAGMSELELGLLDDAWEHAQKAVEIGRHYGHTEIVAMGYRVLGDIYLHLDAPEKASLAYQQGLTVVGQHFMALDLLQSYGYSLFLLGQEAGRGLLLQAVQNATQADLGAIAVLGVVHELSMYLQAGELEHFEERRTWLRQEVIKRTGRDVSGFYTDRLQVEDAFRHGDYARSAALAGPCIEWYRGTRNVWNELGLLLIQEESFRRLGESRASEQPRIEELVNRIDRSLKTAPLQTEWREFLRKKAFSA